MTRENGRMSSDSDGVVEAIDHALTDWEMSPDAMRWTTDVDAVDEHRRPGLWPAWAMRETEEAMVVLQAAYERVRPAFDAAVEEAFARDLVQVHRQAMIDAYFAGAVRSPSAASIISGGDVT